MSKILRVILVLSLFLAAACAGTTETQSTTPLIAKHTVADKFAFGKDDVPAAAEKAVKDTAAEIKKLQSYSKVYVTGHTDNIGGKDRNEELSKQRAQKVADMLTKEGVSSRKIVVTGKGSSEPAESNKTPDGRSKNRRVEIEVK